MKKNKKEDNIPMWQKTGHSKPVTRRDFLAAGLIPFAAQAFIPSWWSMLLAPSSASAAEALNCTNPNPFAWTPVVTLNLSGGGALMGNYVPMNDARTPIASYSKMGLGDNQVPIAREFGNAPFAGVDPATGTLISKFLQGVRETGSNAIPNTAFVGFCVRSRDDSSENLLDISGMLTKAGLSGQLLPNVGVRDTRSGIGQQPAMLVPPAPLIVKSFNDIANSLGYTASLGSQLKTNQKASLAKLIGNLNQTQARKLAQYQGTKSVQDLISCAGINNVNLVQQGSGSVDPIGNAAVSNVWGITTGTAKNSQAYVFGSMVYNAINGMTGAANLEIGGFDYHDNTRTTGDAKDLSAGQTVGRILETARQLMKPVVVYVTTDGSVSSADSTTRNSPWTSDRGAASMAYMIMYNPTIRPATTDFQVGSYTDGQAADDKFVTGNSPELTAGAVFANYLQLHKRMDLLDGITRGKFDAATLKQVVKVV